MLVVKKVIVFVPDLVLHRISSQDGDNGRDCGEASGSARVGRRRIMKLQFRGKGEEFLGRECQGEAGRGIPGEYGIRPSAC